MAWVDGQRHELPEDLASALKAARVELGLSVAMVFCTPVLRRITLRRRQARWRRHAHDHGGHFIPWENRDAWVNDLRHTFNGRRP
jgi:hypothetical protein